MSLLTALAAGALFAAGLVISGMTQPAKVLGFLNLAGLAQGRWDASLAFVMGGALLVTLVAFAVTPPTPRRPQRRPWLAPAFQLPTRRDIDGRLLAGSALFGVGWGLAGYCPGPALVSLLSSTDAALFAAFMLLGMALARRLLRKG
ncbi:MAG: YeeE/YedE family protein [Curvibacter sp.]|nr:YeeE/YedE family protein [Curvibacter sp.]